MKKGFFANIEELTINNSNFRQVLYTGKYSQLVLMTLKPGEEIGMEVHNGTDQFFRFESGEGKVIVNDSEYIVTDGDCVVIPSDCSHNVINTSSTVDLKMYTIYSPSHHKDKVIHPTKTDALNDDEEFDNVTTE